jgi:hypothetical protein
MPSLADAFRTLGELRSEGVIEEYAVGGAMAMLFWAEPTLTYDLDVFVVLRPTSSPLVSLTPIYDWLRARGFEEFAEHVVIHGTPVQFLASPNALADDAIATAAEKDLEGVTCRVMRPEHLCALWLQTGGAKRRERVQSMRDAGVVNDSILRDLLRRHGIRDVLP